MCGPPPPSPMHKTGADGNISASVASKHAKADPNRMKEDPIPYLSDRGRGRAGLGCACRKKILADRGLARTLKKYELSTYSVMVAKSWNCFYTLIKSRKSSEKYCRPQLEILEMFVACESAASSSHMGAQG